MSKSNTTRITKTQRARLAGFGVILSVVFSLGFSHLISPALAVAPPTFFSYQGRILDDAGAPIADATASIIFRIYDGPDTGSDTCLWSNSSASCATATAATITLTDGLFSENLGDTADGYAAINESVFAYNDTLYLAVTINSEALTPLKRITSQGFAINSSLLDGFDSSSSGGTSSFVPVTGSNGNLIITGDPQGSDVSQGALYINPAAPAANETIFGAANNGTSVFRVDAEGDTTLAGNLTITGTNITSGTLIASVFGSSTTQTGALIGLDMDLSTNVVGADGADITGVRSTTVGGTRTGTGTEVYTSFAASGSALTQTTAAGTLSWRGYSATVPAITQTTGSVTADGLLIDFPASGAIVTGGYSSGVRIVPPSISGPAAGSLTGISIGNLTSAGAGSETAISIGSGWDQQISATGFLVSGTGTTTITPSNNADALTITGTNVTSSMLLSVDSLNTNGIIMNIASSSPVTQAGNLTGLTLDLATNVTGFNGATSTNIRLITLGGTFSGSGSELISGVDVSSGSGLTQSTAAGTVRWRGLIATVPPITQTTGTASAEGLRVVFPPSVAITTGGTSTALNIIAPTASGPAAGTLIGVAIGTLTSPGAGTENAITIGDGWDSAITVNSGQMTVAVSGVVGIGLDNTVTTNGLCHSGSDIDVATDATRDIVACSAAPDDYAEWYDSDGTPTPGDVVALTDDTVTFTASQSNPYTGQIIGTIQKTLPIITKATSASLNRTFGIISTSPIQVIGSDLKRQGSHPVPVALSGRVPLHVNDENGAIAPGDPLTASSTAGYAMKANPGDMVIAAALGNFESGQGTIQVFVRFGAGVASDVSAAENTATLASDSSMSSLNMNGNIYMNGNSIISVATIEGLGGRWSINEDGVFSNQTTYQTQIATTQGDRVTFYSTMSSEVSLTLSGTSELSGGQAKIRFADVNPDFGGAISTVAPIRVLVTANGPTGYLYVSEKDNNGFTVEELGDSTSGVSFDWLVIAYRNGYEPEETLEIDTPIIDTTVEETPSEEVIEETPVVAPSEEVVEVVEEVEVEETPSEEVIEETPVVAPSEEVVEVAEAPPEVIEPTESVPDEPAV